MKEVLSLKQAILATLHYFDLLDFAPTAKELEVYLYGWSAPMEAIEEALKTMPEVSHSHGFYCLQHRLAIAELRKERKDLAAKLWRKAKRYSWLIAICPFVEMAAVCNSLAYGNVKKDSDIDLFVVTKAGKLPVARFFLKVLTQIFGMRVHHDKIAGRFCLSFFVSEKAIDLGRLAHEFDPHLAYFIAQMTPIYGKSAYMRFLQANETWTVKYFRRQLSPRLEKLKPHRVAGFFKIILEIFAQIFAWPLDAVFLKRQAQKDAVRRKLFPNSNGILMTKDVFKSHEQDPRGKIATAFELKL